MIACWMGPNRLQSFLGVSLPRNIYTSSHGRFDNFILAYSKSTNKKWSDTISSVWLAKVLRFMKLFPKNCSSSTSASFSADVTQTISSEISNEQYFVQSYEIIEKCEPSVDDIDKDFSCVRLRWQRTMGEIGKYSTSHEIGLVPIDSVRGVFHLVPRDPFIHQLARCARRKKSLEDLNGSSQGWEQDILYVNRFSILSTAGESRWEHREIKLKNLSEIFKIL